MKDMVIVVTSCLMAALVKRPSSVAGGEHHILSTQDTNQFTSQSQRAEDFDVTVTSQSQRAEDFDVTVTSQSQRAEDFDVTVTSQSQRAEDFDVTVTSQSQRAEDFDVTVPSQSQRAEDFDVTVTSQSQRVEDFDVTVTSQSQTVDDFNVTVTSHSQRAEDFDVTVTSHSQRAEDFDVAVTSQSQRVEDFDVTVTSQSQRAEEFDVTVTKNQLTSHSQRTEDFDMTVIKNQPNGSLHVVTNCTHPSVSLDMLTDDDRDILFVFSTEGDVSAKHLTPLTCRVHLTSQSRYVMSAVMLEHSLCGGDGGGVFVLLWDKAERRSWDVCSAWQAPGPDFLTSSNEADVSIEWTELMHPFTLSISIRAMEALHKGQLELRYITATEGEV